MRVLHGRRCGRVRAATIAVPVVLTATLVAPTASGGGGAIAPHAPSFTVTDTIDTDHTAGLAVSQDGYFFCWRRRQAGTAQLAFLDRSLVLHTLRLPDSCTAEAVEQEGTALVAAGNRVFRVTRAGTVTVVAGNGSEPQADPNQDEAVLIAGDGGPATSAPIGPADVAVEPDGGFVIGEGYDVRRVWPDGNITTVAGTGVGGVSGDGGPATSARIYGIRGIAVTPAGGIVLGQAPADAPENMERDDVPLGSVRYIAPTGTITTVAKSYKRSVNDVAVDRVGRIYFADNDGGVRQVLASGRTAAVTSLGSTIAFDPEGGLAGLDIVGLEWIPAPATQHLVVAFDATAGQASASRYRARLRSSVAFTRVAVAVERRGKRVVHAPGLTVSHHFAPGVYTVRVVARRGREVARDALRLVLGGYLPTSLALRAGAYESSARASDGVDDTATRLRKCRRLGPRRYDCEQESTDSSGLPPWTCDSGISVRLADSGLIYTRTYPCPAPRVRPHGLSRAQRSDYLGFVPIAQPISVARW